MRNVAFTSIAFQEYNEWFETNYRFRIGDGRGFETRQSGTEAKLKN